MMKLTIIIVLAINFQLCHLSHCYSQTPPSIPVSVSATPLFIMSWRYIRLSAVSSGNIIRWWDSATGGTMLGTSLSNIFFAISPSLTTTYFAESFDGNLPSSSRVSITVYVDSISLPQITIAHTSLAFYGQPISLILSGGDLGTGAVWKWYKFSCGGMGTYIGSGTGVTDYSDQNTHYFVRAENDCKTTACTSVYIPIDQGVTIIGTVSGCSPGMVSLPFSISDMPPTYAVSLRIEYNSAVLSFHDCTEMPGQFIQGLQNPDDSALKRLCVAFTQDGTSGNVLLGTLNFTYYGGSCSVYFENSLDEGADCEYDDTNLTPLIDTPTTTHYFNGAIIQSNTPTMPVIILSQYSSVCPGTTDTLTITGGCLGDATNWFWYSGSCGGTAVGTGPAIVVSPSMQTIYYIRFEGSIYPATCDSILVSTNMISLSADSVTSAFDRICPGDTTVLSITGGLSGTGGVWEWYIGSCGGTYSTSGATQAVSPSLTTSYFVRVEDMCSTTSCSSITITVDTATIAGSTIIASYDTLCEGLTNTLAVKRR